MSLVLFNSEEKKEPELDPLSNIDQNDIVQIKVFRKDLDNFEFNKKDNVWHLIAPQKFRANSSRINAMLRILNIESYAQLNPDEVDLEQLGLAQPIVSMKLNEYEFKFGNTDAIDQRRYVLFDGKIHLTNDSLYQQLMTNAAFFADPKLLPENFEIKAIQFPENKIERIDGEWQLQTLIDISPDKIKEIVFGWQNATAISGSKYEASTSEAEFVIKISSTNNETIQFVIVSTEPHLILGRKDLNLQYHMGSDVARQLLLQEKASNEDNDDPVMLIN